MNSVLDEFPTIVEKKFEEYYTLCRYVESIIKKINTVEISFDDFEMYFKLLLFATKLGLPELNKLASALLNSQVSNMYGQESVAYDDYCKQLIQYIEEHSFGGR